MTTYLLKSPDGEVTKWTMPEITFQKRLDKQGRYRHVSGIDGSVIRYTFVGVHEKVGASSTTGLFLLKSDAMGINPDQRREAMKADSKLGCSIEYDEEGRAVFRSKKQYARYAESHGFYDRNGGYGSPMKRDERERDIRGLPELALQEYD